MLWGCVVYAGSPVYKTPLKYKNRKNRLLVHACMHTATRMAACVPCIKWASLSHITAHMESRFHLMLLGFFRGFNFLLYCNKTAHRAVDTLYEAWTLTALSIQTAWCD